MGLGGKWKARRGDPVDVYRCVIARRYCIKCGTDLRGQHVDANCPSCQHPIYDSVYGAFLIDAPPQEARRLYNMAPIVLYPMYFLAGLAGLWLAMTLISARGLDQAIDNAFLVVLLCGMLNAVVALVGAVVFTGRHSAAYYLAKYGNARTAIKLGVGLVLFSVALALSWGRFVAPVVEVAFAAAPAAVFLQRLGNLMRLVPNKKLAAYANTAFAVTCALGVTALLILLLEPHALKGSEPWGFVLVLKLLATLCALALGWAILRLVLLARRTLLTISQRTEDARSAEARALLMTDSAANNEQPEADPPPTEPAKKKTRNR
jgi:hypothetical protein